MDGEPEQLLMWESAGELGSPGLTGRLCVAGEDLEGLIGVETGIGLGGNRVMEAESLLGPIGTRVTAFPANWFWNF